MSDSIRNYKNKVLINFDERGESLTLDVPHFKKWKSAISFLIRRGFKISENQSYKEHFTCLSKYHKIGFKKDVAVLLEIGAFFIHVEFGSVKNLWTGIAQSFWDDPRDDRYTKLSYLEGVAVKLEIKKLTDFCKKWGLEMVLEDDKLTPVELIIKDLNINKHIHGEVKSLNDIKLSIESGVGKHNQGSNSQDKNKKQITCGDKKYFYDHSTKRLSCGTAWHHINNMWWVLYGNKRRNIASFELFDFNPSLPRKKPVDQSGINYLLKANEEKKDYKKCLHIQQYAKRKQLIA